MQEKCEEFSNRVVKLVPQEDHRYVRTEELSTPCLPPLPHRDLFQNFKSIFLSIDQYITNLSIPSILILSHLSPLLLHPSVFLSITASFDNHFRELLFAMLEDVSSEYVLLALHGIGYLARYVRWNCWGIHLIWDQGLNDIYFIEIDEDGAHQHPRRAPSLFSLYRNSPFILINYSSFILIYSILSYSSGCIKVISFISDKA